MTAAQRRLDSFRKLLEHGRERLGIDFGFVLWDGSTVPAESAGGRARRSALPTRAWWRRCCAGRTSTRSPICGSSARLDIRNGTIFELVTRRPKVRTRDIVRGKTIDRGQALATAAALPVRVARRAVAARRHPARPAGQRRPGGEQAQRPVRLRPLEPLLRAVRRSGDGGDNRVLPRLEPGLRDRAAQQARHHLPQAAAASPASACSTSARAGAG